jgi:photosystem II stability/assembly factor-like uncharacterized protein
MNPGSTLHSAARTNSSRRQASAAPARGAVLACAAALLAVAPLRGGTQFWTSLGPDGGNATAVLADPVDPAVVYVGTGSGGVFKSVDGGGTWQSASHGLVDYSMTGLAADPNHPGTLYAAAPTSLAVSHDAGTTWSPIAIPPVRGIPLGNLLSVAVDPLSSAVYLGTNFTVWVSPDGGAHWTPSKEFRHELITVVPDPVRGSVFAVFFDSGGDSLSLFETMNSGATWNDRSAGLPPQGLVLNVEPVAPGRLWLSARGHAYRSSDGGATWQREPGGYPVAVGAGGLVVSDRFRSLDGGDTWLAAGAPPDVVTSLAISADPSRIYAGGTTTGMMVSTDTAQSWQVANQGLTATAVEVVGIEPRAPRTFYSAVASLGLFKSTDAGGEWLPIAPELTVEDLGRTSLVLDKASPTTLYFVDPNTFPISRSTDGGASWTPLPVPPGECFGIASLTPDPVSPAVLYATGLLGGPPDCEGRPRCTAFKSVDAGESWTCLPSPGALQVFVAPSKPATLYGLGAFGPGRSFLWRSVDAGAHWSSIDAGLPPIGNLVPAPVVAIDPTNAQRLFVSAATGSVWRTVDGGQHWQELDHGLPRANEPAMLAMDARNPQLLYAAASQIGVYRSLNGGRTWQPILAGLPPFGDLLLPGVRYNDLETDPQRSGSVYLATSGRGVLTYSAP